MSLRADYNRYRDEFLATPFLEGEEALYNEVKEAFAAWDKTGEEMIISRKKDIDSTTHFNAQLSNEFKNASNKLFAAFEQIVQFHNTKARERVEAAEVDANLMRKLSWGLILVGICIVFILGIFLSNSITRPLATVITALRDIAQGEGDLTRRLNVQSKNELRQVADWFNAFVARIQSAVSQIGQNVVALADAATQLKSEGQSMYIAVLLTLSHKPK
ncbi:MAG: methyl-accepting chemotaxis protein [Deltaproteobacteria bacterium]|nr:methyl-accepting chemotaxis protein [Deltaproteobacteria bacterium]